MREAFLTAITEGDVAKVKDFLSSDPQLAAAKDEKGVSAVTKAAYYRKSEVLSVLLATGVRLDIFEAAITGQTDRVKSLIKSDPSLANSFSVDGFTPLGLSVFFGNKETVEVLLANGAEGNVASRESMKVTPLHSAAAGRQAAIARLLIEHGANVNARQIELGFTPLHEAAGNGDLEFAELLVERGADVNAKMTDGKTPLAYALDHKQNDMAEFLRKHGAK
jgi:uncharacterized protein